MSSAVRAPAAPPGVHRASAVTTVTTAVVLATAPGDHGGPAATLPFDDGTILERMVSQLRGLGIRSVHVVVRTNAGALPPLPADVRVHASEDSAADLRLIAALARGQRGGMLVTPGEIITQRSVLAGLLADPRVATGIVTTVRPGVGRPFAYRVRHRRSRVVGAASPFHVVHGGDASFLGLLKVDAPDREAVASAAERLAGLITEPSEAWRVQLEVVRRGSWTLALDTLAQRRARHAAAEAEEDQENEEALESAAREAETRAELEGRMSEEPADVRTPDTVELAPEDAAELELRLRAAAEDLTPMLLVALVRDGVAITSSRLRFFFWARPMTGGAAEFAQERLARRDEDRILLNAAVKVSDGFFTTHFVSPYSRFIARWAARRGLTPNQVTSFSMLLGLLAAAAFATGDRWGLITGAIVLQAAFTFDCVDGQLARYTRQFSRLGAWLDSIFDRGKEYAVFAGLAIGASNSGDDVWVLACAALALQVTRHAIDFSYPAAQAQILVDAVEHPPLEQPSDGRGAELPRWLRGDAPPRGGSRHPAPSPPASRRTRVLLAWRAVGNRPALRWAKKAFVFPIGERFAAISLTAAFFDARVTFSVMLVWGGLAASYIATGRLLRVARSDRYRSIAPQASAPDRLVSLRDDGAIARGLGAVLGPRVALRPGTLAAAGLLVLVAGIVATGADASEAVAGAFVAGAVLLAGISAGRPVVDPLRWTVPPLLRALEYAGITWLAATAGSDAVPGAFALLCAAAFRHYDLVYRARQLRDTGGDRIGLLGGGWDGRIVLTWLLVALAAEPAGLFVAAAALGLLFAGEAATWWATFNRADRTLAPDEEEEIE